MIPRRALSWTLIATLGLALSAAGCRHLGSGERPGSRPQSLGSRSGGGTGDARALAVVSRHDGEDPCTLTGSYVRPESGDPKAVVLMVPGFPPGTGAPKRAPSSRELFGDLEAPLVQAGFAVVRGETRLGAADCSLIDSRYTPAHARADLVAFLEKAGVTDAPTDPPVVLMGHRQGVTQVLRMAADGSPRASGLISLSGLGRFPEDAALLRSMREHNQEGTTAEAKKQLNRAGQFFFKLRDGGALPPGAFLRVSPRFWMDWLTLSDRTPLWQKRVEIPALTLHAEDQAYATLEDFQALKDAFSENAESEAHRLPGLDGSYRGPGRSGIAEEVSAVITQWLKGLSYGQKV